MKVATTRSSIVIAFGCWITRATGWAAQEVATGQVYSVMELSFQGPRQTPMDTPGRDIDFTVRFRHEESGHEHLVHGFWDGDGHGGTSGDVFKVRFTPTQPGGHRSFKNLDTGFRMLAWPEREYVLGTDKERKGMIAALPEGTWTVTRYDIMAKESLVLSRNATGDFKFDAPASRLVSAKNPFNAVLSLVLRAITS